MISFIVTFGTVHHYQKNKKCNTFIDKKSTLYNMLSVAKIDMKNDVQNTLNYFFSATILNMQKKEVSSKKIFFYEAW